MIRSWLTLLLVGAATIAGYFAGSTKHLEVSRPTNRIAEAPIWVARCARQKKQFVAVQADGGRWTAKCVDADLSRR